MSVAMPIGAFLAAVLVLIPLPWHWRARNIPTLSIIVWLFAVNVARGVNAIAWADNIDRKLLVWCDIVTRLVIAANVALPAACFCLCMHLESVASVRRVRSTHSDKRRRMIVDCAVCFGIPIIYLALFYVVQGHRFDIVEGFGCQAEDYVSIPEFFLVWLPPILFALGTFVFATLSFMHFFRRRATFAKHLASSRSALTPARYFRLMAMSLLEMFWSLAIISITLYFNYRDGLRPWTNWADVHSNWSNINRFPAFLIPPASLRLTQFLWWTTPISAYIFVAFFAFGEDAIREYSACLSWVRRNVLRQKIESTGASSLAGTYPPPSASLPSYTSKADSPIFIDIPKSKFEDNCLSYTPTTTDSTSTNFRRETHSFVNNLPSYYEEHSIPSSPDTPSALSDTTTLDQPPTAPFAAWVDGGRHPTPIARYDPTNDMV